MTTIVLPTQKAIGWVAKRVGEGPDDFGQSVGFGVLIDGKPAAGVVYSWYRKLAYGSDMMVTIAADDPRWCRRAVLRKLFEYPFVTAGCTRLTALIKEGNARSIKLCTGLGFRKEGTVRRGYNGKSNALVFGMLREECKWIR